MGSQYCLSFLAVLFLQIGTATAYACVILGANQTPHEEITIEENTQANFSFQLRLERSITESAFVIEIKMSENGKYYDACRCRWLSKNNGVCKNQRNVSICETDSYEMRFSLLVQRSYGDIIWELYTTNCTPLTLRKTKLQVTYSAKVTGLEVDGQEVNETYLVEDNQKVNISCSFTNGNPPVSVRLMDDIGSALNSSKHKEGPLTLIIGMFRCSEVWPTVRCEAAGSKLNRSVTILGRCLPQLSHIGSQLVALPKVLKEGLKLRLRSYTSDIRNCLVTKLPPQPTTKKVTCELSGRIPNFSLTMRFAGEMLIDEGIWILHAITELGFSNITFVLINNTGGGEYQ
ncbi:uncharacterized protein LOC112567915 [Pomacea canaliculata]|uniref:uncharacterized protein LOC112567915 n=1 Tax=Pomacea canaliculata TaxID=400727 RepID=UPI000D72BA26|nr:uncharacterized protein LOC112567915 [Pomacea canaliculata]